MTGHNRFSGKVMSTVVNMDRLVGKDFEAGLAKLKAEAEAGGTEGSAPGTSQPSGRTA